MVEATHTAEQDRSDERDRELRLLRQKHSQQVQILQQIIQSQTSCLAEKDQTIARKEEIIVQKDETIAELRQQAQQQLGKKERELTGEDERIDQLKRQQGCVNQQLEQVTAQFQRRTVELEQLRPATDTSSSSKKQRTSIKLTWREGEKAPCEMSGSYHAAVDSSSLYVVLVDQTFCYTISTSSWSQLPGSPTFFCTSVIINSLLTLVGGRICGARTITNKLFSLTGEGSGRRWTEKFPPMPTKRYGTIVLCTEAALIVAGGENDESTLQTVEVMDIGSLQWSTAADLPQPLSYAPASLCGDQVYILRELEFHMYTCSLQVLLKSCKSFLASLRNKGARVWKKVAAPPVIQTTCVSIHGRLLAVGGRDSDKEPTSAIHMYTPTTDSWEVISHMETPRKECIAAVLCNQLMVVGGFTTKSKVVLKIGTKSVEFATVE